MRKIFLLLLIVAGCNKPDVPPSSWRGEATILPIIITKNYETNWTTDWVFKQQEWTNIAYKKTGLYFKFQDPVYIENESLYDIDSVDFGKIVVEAGSIVNKKNAFPIWFVETIVLGDINAGGVSNYPSNPPGFNCGVALASNSKGGWDLMAHELGHSFNLPHTWEDDFSDTLQTDINQKCEIQPCNIMNYCFTQFLTCQNEELFTPQQTVEIRRWASGGPRTKVVKVISGSVIQTTLKTTSNTSPQIDPIEIFSNGQ